MIPDVVCIDFETEPIQPRPNYPPTPVGASIKWPGQPSHYFAFGHPSGNNCTLDDAREELVHVWDSGLPILIHSGGGFDLKVAYEQMGLPKLPWQRVHDTVYLLFLHDPHAANMQLKSAAHRLLGMAPEEQDAIAAWVWEHRKELVAQYGGRITRAKTGDGSAAAWISKVPSDIVAPYAEGDTDRTAALFRYLYPRVRNAGMLEAYDRERRLLPIFMENERVGLRVDVESLQEELPGYQAALERAEAGMRHYLNAPDLSFDDDRALADAFQAAGAVFPDRWVRTAPTKTYPHGQLSVSKDNLTPDAFTDPDFASVFGYRNRLKTCLTMFMEPWAEQAAQNNGYIHTQWNQVLSSKGGARTGRPSMSKPNLLNVSKAWDDRSDGYVHPEKLGLPELPLVRRYILPDEGHLFVHRDFSGQELRVFAHFESGELLQQYLANPELDPHGWVKDEIARLTGRILPRGTVKIINFQSIYGGGITALTKALRCTRAEAAQFKAFHDGALPGRKTLYEEILRLVRRNEPIRTWGGRLYYVESPALVNGRMQTWEYKLINYLVQGSAADITKEAICRWHEGGGTNNGARFILTVYDEINLSTPREKLEESMKYLREVMDGIELDCPLRSEGAVGLSWGSLVKV